MSYGRRLFDRDETGLNRRRRVQLGTYRRRPGDYDADERKTPLEPLVKLNFNLPSTSLTYHQRKYDISYNGNM